MSVILSEITEVCESLWPISGAEDWDRPGLAAGNPTQEVSRALLTVDVTIEVLEEARSRGCDLVISHHPLLLKPVNFLPENQLKGGLVSYAIKNSIALYSAHTNADIVIGGVSDVLANAVGLKNTVPLVETGSGIGHGRIGDLSSAVELSELASRVKQALPNTAAPVRVAGPLNKLIERVAVVGGAGDSFIDDARRQGVQCLITSDLRHHVSLDAVGDPDRPLSLIDVSHFAAESLWLEPTAAVLRKRLPGIEFFISEVITDPWTMTI